MATLILPAPPSGAGNNWNKAWQAYQADPVGGYAAYYNFLAAGQTSGPILAAGNYPAPGTPGAPSPQNPGGTPGGSSTPSATVPDVWAPGGGTHDTRFGDYTLAPYLLASGTGSPGTSAPVPAVPSAAPVPPAAVPAGGGGAGGPAAGAGVPPAVPPAAVPPAAQPGAVRPPQGQGGMFGGNEGGARQADRGGMFGSPGSGGNSGFGNQPAASGNGASSNGMLGSDASAWDQGYIDLGPWGSRLLGTAATLAPGWAGVGLGALQAGMRGYNTMNTNTIRGSQGIPDTDFGQFLGSVLGLNNYGGLDGNATVANPDQLGQRLGQVPAYNIANDFFGRFGAPAETAQGGTYSSGPGGLLGLIFGGADTRALAPGEVNHLVRQTTDPDISALWNGADGNSGAGGSILGGVRNPGSSGASMTTGDAGMRGIGAGNLTDAHAIAKAKAQAYDAAQKQAALGFDGNQGNAFGLDRGFDAGNNSNDRSSPNTNAAGQASNATGSFGQRGIGAGTYATGGYVRGQPDRIPDNRMIAANEGEFVVRNAAARAAGRRLLGMLNTPAGAARLRGMLG